MAVTGVGHDSLATDGLFTLQNRPILMNLSRGIKTPPLYWSKISNRIWTIHRNDTFGHRIRDNSRIRDRMTCLRYTDRYTGGQIDTQTDRQAHRQTDRQVHKQIHTDRQTDRQTDIQYIDRQTDMYIDRQPQRQKNRQVHRQTDWCVHIHTD